MTTTIATATAQAATPGTSAATNKDRSAAAKAVAGAEQRLLRDL